jgi:CxxC-x17-CxxC domain-containing protein
MKNCSVCHGMRLEVYKAFFLCPVCKNDELVSYVNENYVKQNAIPQRYDLLLENMKNIQFLEELDNEVIDEKISQIGITLYEIKAGYLSESMVEYAKWIQNKNNEKNVAQKYLEVSLEKNEIESQKIISAKNKKIVEIEKQKVQTEAELSFSKFKEKSSIDNLKYVLNLIEYIKKEKSMSIEQIKKQLKEKKQEDPSLTDLQALYYVALDNKIFFFKKWVRLSNRFPNTCHECGEKTTIGQDIFWNPATSQVKHFDCKLLIQQKKRISKLSESANNYFVRGERDEGIKIMNQIKKIKFLLIFENSELSKKLEPILQNDVNFLRFLKTFDYSVMNSAKSVEFEDFLKVYRIKFIEICSLEISEDINKEFDYILENKPDKKGIFDKLVADDYIKYTKNLTYILNSTEGNSEVFQKIVRECGKNGLFYDPYMKPWVINYFYKNFPEDSKMTELRLLTTIRGFKIKRHLKLMKQSIVEFKKFLESKEIKLQVKVIQEKIPEDHDRYFYGDNTYLVMSQGMDRFLLSSKNATVAEIDPRFREEFKKITENRYRSESCIDFLENYEKMEKELPEEIVEDREMFDVKCSDCGNDCQVPFQPKQDRHVYCRECLQNHR